MVKKLYKYEYRSYWLWCVLIYGAIIAAALLFRLTLGVVFQAGALSEIALRSASTISTILIFSSGAIYFMTISAGLTLMIVMPIIRFYKNLLSSEGYLTLSIPVTPATHIICKTVVAYTYMIGAIVSFIGSVFIFLVGWEDSPKIFSTIGRGISEIFSTLAESGPVVVISFIAVLIALILAPIATYLMYYFCLSMGMLFGKYKIIGAVVFYIGLQTALSVLGGSLEIILMPFMIAIENTDVMSIVFSVGYLLFVIAEICIFFGFSHHMFKHKVNI